MNKSIRIQNIARAKRNKPLLGEDGKVVPKPVVEVKSTPVVEKKSTPIIKKVISSSKKKSTSSPIKNSYR